MKLSILTAAEKVDDMKYYRVVVRYNGYKFGFFSLKPFDKLSFETLDWCETPDKIYLDYTDSTGVCDGRAYGSLYIPPSDAEGLSYEQKRILKHKVRDMVKQVFALNIPISFDERKAVKK